MIFERPTDRGGVAEFRADRVGGRLRADLLAEVRGGERLLVSGLAGSQPEGQKQEWGLYFIASSTMWSMTGMVASTVPLSVNSTVPVPLAGETESLTAGERRFEGKFLAPQGEDGMVASARLGQHGFERVQIGMNVGQD